jgi:hypothetical protein
MQGEVAGAGIKACRRRATGYMSMSYVQGPAFHILVLPL